MSTDTEIRVVPVFCKSPDFALKAAREGMVTHAEHVAREWLDRAERTREEIRKLYLELAVLRAGSDPNIPITEGRETYQQEQSIEVRITRLKKSLEYLFWDKADEIRFCYDASGAFVGEIEEPGDDFTDELAVKYLQERIEKYS